MECVMLDFRDPMLNDILADPIIRQVMVSDGVDAEDVRTLMRRVHGHEIRTTMRRPAVGIDATDREIIFQSRTCCEATAIRP